MSADRRHALPPCALEELGFWEEELRLAGKHPEIIRNRLDPARRAIEFPSFLADPVLPIVRRHFGLDGPARCLELGPGPLSSLAWGVDQGLLDVTAVDVLADEFGALLDRFGIDYPIRPVRGAGETLAEQFEAGSFHVVFVRNALDHTDDAPRSFANLVRMARPGGGILLLQHHLNEGDHREWSASHKWNLDIGAKGLSVTGRDGVRHELATQHDLELVYLSYRSYLLDGWIDAVYRRR